MTESDAPRRAAEVYLEEQFLLFLRHLTIVHRDPEMVDEIDASVAAVRALGLISEDDQRLWEARAARLRATKTPRRPRVVKARAKEHLERIVQSAVSLPEGPDLVAARRRLQSAATVFQYLGLVTENQGFQWRHNRLPEPLDRDPEDSAAVFRATGTPRIVAATPSRAGDLRVLTVALFDDGVVLTLQRDPVTAACVDQRTRPNDLNDDLTDRLIPRLTDDHGTRYVMCGGSITPFGYALDAMTAISASYTPAVPREASRLIVLSEDDALEIVL